MHPIEDINLRLSTLFRERFKTALKPELWDYLVKKAYVGKVQSGKETINWLCDEAWHILEAGGGADRVIRALQAEPILSSKPDRQRVDRQTVLSMLIAREAEKDPYVLAFRKNKLKGGLLSPEEVENWIKRQAQNDGSPTGWLEVPVPQGHTLRSNPETGYVYVQPNLTLSQERGGTRLRWKILHYGVPHSEFERGISVTAGGILDHLRWLSEHLANSYGWQDALATRFILTGEVPFISAITGVVSTGARGSISLKIDPTLSSQQVASAYRLFRRQVMGHTRNRSLSPKHLRLAEFIVKRSEGESWRERLQAWNKAHPDWNYKHESNFRRDCIKVNKRLIEPVVTIWQVLDKMAVKPRQKVSDVSSTPLARIGSHHGKTKR